MPVDVTTSIVINRSYDDVAAYAADPENAPDWYVNITSARWRTAPPLAVGSEFDFVAEFLRRQLTYTYRVTELVPGRTMTMSTAQGPFPMSTTYTWDALSPTSTRMSLRNHGSPHGFARLLSLLMPMAVRRANRKDLARLKQVLEQPSR